MDNINDKDLRVLILKSAKEIMKEVAENIVKYNKALDRNKEFCNKYSIKPLKCDGNNDYTNSIKKSNVVEKITNESFLNELKDLFNYDELSSDCYVLSLYDCLMHNYKDYSAVINKIKAYSLIENQNIEDIEKLCGMGKEVFDGEKFFRLYFKTLERSVSIKGLNPTKFYLALCISLTLEGRYKLEIDSMLKSALDTNAYLTYICKMVINNKDIDFERTRKKAKDYKRVNFYLDVNKFNDLADLLNEYSARKLKEKEDKIKEENNKIIEERNSKKEFERNLREKEYKDALKKSHESKNSDKYSFVDDSIVFDKAFDKDIARLLNSINNNKKVPDNILDIVNEMLLKYNENDRKNNLYHIINVLSKRNVNHYVNKTLIILNDYMFNNILVKK